MLRTSPTYSTTTGSLLFSWLGSFWTMLCEDSDLVKQVQMGRGILASKLYQEFVESLNLNNRNDIPTYHNDLITAITLKLSDRDSSDAVSIFADMDPTPCIGPQTTSPFTTGTIMTIGGKIAYDGITTYPIASDIADINILTDSITNPTIILVKGINFQVKDATLYFINSSDPFDDFDLTTTNIYEDSQVADQSITLFAFNALFERYYAYNHAGYIFNIDSNSSTEYTTALNRLWDVYNLGPVKQVFQSSLAALLGEPAIIDDEEIVQVIIPYDNFKQIVTNTHVYTVTADSEVRDSVVPNAVLVKGDLLTKTIKIYENVDFNRLAAENEYNTEFRTDVPSLFLPPTLFRATLNSGLSVSFEYKNITYNGVDSNDNDKFKFDMYGSDDDIKTLWDDVAAYCETNDIAMSSIFEGYLSDNYPKHVGSVCGKIEPLRFFLDNLFKANLFIVVINTSKLTSYGVSHFNDISKLRPLIPAHTYMIVLERVNITGDNYDMETEIDISYNTLYVKSVSDLGSYSKFKSMRKLTYHDAGVVKKWIPVCN